MPRIPTMERQKREGHWKEGQPEIQGKAQASHGKTAKFYP